jgi:thiol reductant ABC exporter CydD subunit
MPAVDRRLLTHARATKGFLGLSVLSGLATAVLVIAQAWLLATLITSSVQRGEGVAELRAPLVALLLVIVARSLLAWAAEVVAHHASARVKSQLRHSLLRHALDLGPSWLKGRRTAELEALSTRGLDGLDGYFSQYLPQLVLAVVVPLAVLGAVAGVDLLAAAIIAVTLPLIPLFMALVGASTKARTAKRLATLQHLGGHFLDNVAGLTTLKVFGRARSRTDEVGRATDAFRKESMSTLRVAFLSSLVLELLASLSVAVVAVAIGLRLVNGSLDLWTGLFVLVLAPEAYLPLRLLGAGFHASADGVAAADQVFKVLDSAVPSSDGHVDIPDPAATEVRIEDACVCYPDRADPALDHLTLTVRPGEVVALTGPSGCGKSTLIGVLLGFVALDSGRVSIDGHDVTELDLEGWRRLIAWVPQRPFLFATTLADNIRLGRADATDAEVRQAVHDAGMDDLIDRLPDGLATEVGERGAGLSAGERQRVALARAFVRDAPLLLLDEPTAGLDGATEASVLDALRLLTAGRTVVMAAHRPSLLALADTEVRLGAAMARART